MLNSTEPPNSTDWFAHVKYKDDGETEVVRVCKISYVRRARDGKILGFEPWRPKSLDDIDKTGYNYHVLTNLNTKSGEEERFYAACGRLATNRESLLQQTKDRVRYPSSLPKFSDSATEAEESADERVSAVTLLKNQRSANRQRDSLKLKASASMFKSFMDNNQMPEVEAFEPQAKKSKHYEAPESSGDNEAHCMQQKIIQLQKEISDLERKREALADFDLKQLIRDAVKDFVKPELDSVKSVVTTHVQQTETQYSETKSKICDLDKKLDQFSELISKLPCKTNLQFVQRWVDSLA